MINFLNSKTVYLGTDMKKFNEIRDCLDANNIKYKYKVTNRMGKWEGHGTTRSRMGSAGNPSDLMYQYEILVHKDDYAKVKLQ